MSIDFDQLDQALTPFEKTLNTIGYIPIASMLSGTVRAVYAKVEVIVALALTAFHFIASCFSAGHGEKAARALSYVLHGVANFGRAVVEVIPFVNLSCILYDLTVPRLEYPSIHPRAIRPLA
ncbi:MAG TPA: hypothetical protein VLF94_06780 [Chlamydiales bacterium]|nr:hypothetical protein [Chlamydiales bacterium]